MNVADTLYVLVGYKLDDASARRVEQHFEKVRDLAQGVAKNAQATNAGLRTYTQSATRAATATSALAASEKAAGDQAVSLSSKLSSAAAGIAAAGATLVAGGAAVAAKSLFDQYQRGASEIVQLAAATNTSVESFSSLAFVAKSAGVPVDDLRDGLNDLSEKAGEAYTALKEGKKDNEYLKTFRELNIDLKSFVALKPDQRFEQFADALNKVSDPGRRSAISMKLMSDEGTKFNIIFNKGTKEIQRLRAEAVALGATMGTDAAKSLSSYNVAVARFEARITALANRLGAEALPLLTDAMNQFLDAASPGEVRAFGDGLIGAMRDFHAIAIPVVKDMIGLAKGARDLIKELGGVVNLLKLILIGIIALKAPAVIAAWSVQAQAIAGVAKAMIALIYTFGGGRAALVALTAQLRAAGSAAALTAGKMALVAIPLLAIEDYAVWSSGGESVIGAIFGAKTQDNIDAVHAKLSGVALVFAGLVALVVGVPAGIAVAIGAVGALAYSSAEDFKMFFTGLFGLLGIWTTALFDSIKSGLRAVFVDLPTNLGEMLNEKLSFIGGIGAMGPSVSPAADAAVGGTTNTAYNSSQAITVQVDARGTTDPAAVGAATQGGVLDAARQMQTQYNNGVKG